MFSHTVQPPLISLLNSAAIPALSPLWTAHTDPDLPEDSAICVVMDDEPTASSSSSSSSEGRNWKPVTQGWGTTPPSQNLDYAAQLAFVPKHIAIGSLAQPVIHIQSPTIRTTYIQSGSLSQPLGVELPWFGIQFRRLGGREVSLEVGVVDTQGNEGRIRFSSFQVRHLVRLRQSLYES